MNEVRYGRFAYSRFSFRGVLSICFHNHLFRMGFMSEKRNSLAVAEETLKILEKQKETSRTLVEIHKLIHINIDDLETKVKRMENIIPKIIMSLGFLFASSAVTIYLLIESFNGN